MYGEGISYPRSPSGHKEGAVWDEKTVARAQTMDTPHRHRRGRRGAQFFLTVHVACAVAARLHAPADLLQHLAARSAVPSYKLLVLSTRIRPATFIQSVIL